tara:strand:+ start:642 stop:1277 length:636 start_codon:yes stop_codon:yes gene_type:complete
MRLGQIRTLLNKPKSSQVYTEAEAISHVIECFDNKPEFRKEDIEKFAYFIVKTAGRRVSVATLHKEIKKDRKELKKLISKTMSDIKHLQKRLKNTQYPATIYLNEIIHHATQDNLESLNDVLSSLQSYSDTLGNLPLNNNSNAHILHVTLAQSIRTDYINFFGTEPGTSRSMPTPYSKTCNIVAEYIGLPKPRTNAENTMTDQILSKARQI